MATTKGKKGIKKSARMKKGKTLQTVKPLETINFKFGNLGVQYKQQSPTG